MMPGCQVITTVIDKDGNTVVQNEIWMTPDAGGKGLDHAAVQPHTAGRKARTCESCHNNPKALGYGIEDGRFLKRLRQGIRGGPGDGDRRDHPAAKTQMQSQAVPEAGPRPVADRHPRRASSW